MLTGSIACFKACELISMLVRAGHEVKAVCSQNALKFIGLSTLEGLTGKDVYCDMFKFKGKIEHISLSDWADLTVVCPATANIINKMALGVGDDAPSTLFLAHDFQKPFLVAPAMNQKMYAHPVVKQSIKRLADLGIKVLPTAVGRQACGDVGEGRMLEPREIFDFITSEFK